MQSRSYIVAASLDRIRSAYTDVPDDIIDEIVQLDPSSDVAKGISGKSVKWLLNLYRKGKLKEEDFYKVSEYLSNFYRNKGSLEEKDIMKYDSLSSLAAALSSVVLTDRQQARRMQSAVRNVSRDIRPVFQSGKWSVYCPSTFEEDRYLAQVDNKFPNHWCTAADPETFNKYHSQGPLYVLLSKSSSKRYQFHFETMQFMDNDDSPVSPAEILRDDIQCANFLVNEFVKQNQIDATIINLQFPISCWEEVISTADPLRVNQLPDDIMLSAATDFWDFDIDDSILTSDTLLEMLNQLSASTLESILSYFSNEYDVSGTENIVRIPETYQDLVNGVSYAVADSYWEDIKEVASSRLFDSIQTVGAQYTPGSRYIVLSNPVTGSDPLRALLYITSSEVGLTSSYSNALITEISNQLHAAWPDIPEVPVTADFEDRLIDFFSDYN